jgi:Flp pilus assembly protein TadD
MRVRPALFLAVLLAAFPAAARAQDIASAADDALIEQAIQGGRLVQARTMLAQRQMMAGEQAEPALEILNAELAIAERRNDQALAGLMALKAKAIGDCRVDGGIGIVLVRSKRAEEAMPHLRAAVQACADRWRYWNALGIALDLSRDWPASAEAYERAYALSGGEASVMNNYGFSLMAQQRHKEAARLFAAAAQAEPGNQRYANNADIARGMAGEPLKAQDADRADGDRWARRLNNAGYAALLAGRPDQAKAYFSRSLHASESHEDAAEANLAAIAEGK